MEDWVFHQLENTTHLLHAVVHSNGFGHLLRVNGREGGSRFLSGCHIMDFWDRLCKTLGVRLAFSQLILLYPEKWTCIKLEETALSFLLCWIRVGLAYNATLCLS